MLLEMSLLPQKPNFTLGGAGVSSETLMDDSDKALEARMASFASIENAPQYQGPWFESSELTSELR
jgi:hypothetical protein